MSLNTPSTGQNPQRENVSLPVGGSAANTETPLAASGTWTSGWIDTQGFNSVFVRTYSDVASATNGYVLELSQDGVIVADSSTTTYTTVGDFRRSAYSPTTRFIRYSYTNGASPQTKFYFLVSLSPTLISPHKQALASTMSDTNLADIVKNVQEAPDTAGTYGKVTRTVSGSNSGLDVNVLNPQSTTGLATAANQTTGNSSLSTIATNTGNSLTNTQLRASAVPVSLTSTTITGSVAVTGTFFPGTQPISIAATVATKETQPTTETTTNVTNSTSNQTALASNANRRMATFYNDDTLVTGASVYLKCGATASATSFKIKIAPGGYYELPSPVYTGIVDVIATAATGTLRIGES